MNAAPASRTLCTPPTLDAALRLLAEAPGQWRAFAGGTDLMVALTTRHDTPAQFINILPFPELHGITVTNDTVDIGACTTYTQIQTHSLLQHEFAMLGAAARLTGGVAIQNRGTLGGNIANASPAADSLPVLLAYDAAITVQSARGTRTLAYDAFHTGYKQTQLAPDELITRIQLQRPRAPRVEYFRKVGTREAQSITKVSLAACADVRAGRITSIRLGMGSVAPMPLRCRRTEAVLHGAAITPDTLAAAQRALLEEITPIDDLRSTAAYRRRVAQNLLAAWYVELDRRR